ncbi:major histocompatibility complex class I-related gene protein-like [Carassius auratus]|uniref:Major histocompatibility complex class I-related gene protein-like n=1 Tax=Carassius auratus TaxID=7957 RepID=A0A6P6NNY5_CARAU|nr:major histocompatibility complex class I-related gene protein-like [Carassius auratus]
MDKILLLFVFLLPTAASKGSHSLHIQATYTKSQSLFPEYSITFMLDDIIIGYYDSATKLYIKRGHTTEENDAFNENYHRALSDDMFTAINHRLELQFDNHTHIVDVHQTLIHCELLENMESGKITVKGATGGSTVVELHFLNKETTFSSSFNIVKVKPFVKYLQENYEQMYYSIFMETLKANLKMRKKLINRKVKPRVRLLQKANSDSGGSRVSCLATGFYPRHINLTLFRDGQPVSDHEITGGDLLPNDDGTYQMRKSLEISRGDKRTYTCSVTHLSLDNKLDVTLEYPGVTFRSVRSTVPVVLVLGLLLLTVAAIILNIMWRKRWHYKK